MTVPVRSAYEAQLVAQVVDSLAMHLMDNARFMAERLHAEFKSESNAYLLATCNYWCDRAYSAYQLLQGCHAAQSRYLLALCCLKLGKYHEAESALEPKASSDEVPNGAYGYFLLGKVCKLSNRHNRAIKNFERALTLNPMLWGAYEELCTLGAFDAADRIMYGSASGNPPSSVMPAFRPVPRGDPQAAALMPPPGLPPGGGAPPARAPAAASGGAPSPAGAPLGPQAPGGPAFVTPFPPRFATPSFMTPAAGQPPAAPPVLAGKFAKAPTRYPAPQNDAPGSMLAGIGPPDSAAADASLTFAAAALDGALHDGPSLSFAPAGGFPGARAAADDAAAGAPGVRLGLGDAAQRALGADGVRRSARAKPGGRGGVDPPEGAPSGLETPRLCGAAGDDGACTPVQVASLPWAGVSSEALVSPSLPVHAPGANSAEGQAACMALLRALGKGLRLLAEYKCSEALEAFKELPTAHYTTAWVLSHIGKAYFEMVDYHNASLFFEWSRTVDPYRLEDLEVYSTVLWHMKKEVEMSHLAQDALSLDRLSPQAWCVMGNCFSLQKEHETALRFFQRALQLEPHFTYAYTLCGHEYFANEDFDKSLAFYRNAITRDPRHYNAWYGIGQIYYRQEKYEMAINNFKHAHQINPRSSVLMCYLGMAFHKQGFSGEALAWLQSAIDADARNPLARFERATVLISQEKFKEAIEELERLKDIAPREATVYYQMGRIYKKLKQVDKALTHFCHAMDLKPTSTDQNLIKSAIEKLHVDDEEVDEEI